MVHGMLDADEEFFKKTGEPLFSSHMLDLSEESDEENIGGEEDGVNNERAKGIVVHFARNRIQGLRALSPIGPNFSIAAAFGNVHGVYKPGNVQLKPEILGEHQKYAKEQSGSKNDKPLFLVFHGGSGSSQQEFDTAITHGVVKVNLDTDCQYAYLSGVCDYILKKQDYLKQLETQMEMASPSRSTLTLECGSEKVRR